MDAGASKESFKINGKAAFEGSLNCTMVSEPYCGTHNPCALASICIGLSNSNILSRTCPKLFTATSLLWSPSESQNCSSNTPIPIGLIPGRDRESSNIHCWVGGVLRWQLTKVTNDTEIIENIYFTCLILFVFYSFVFTTHWQSVISVFTSFMIFGVMSCCCNSS